MCSVSTKKNGTFHSTNDVSYMKNHHENIVWNNSHHGIKIARLQPFFQYQSIGPVRIHAKTINLNWSYFVAVLDDGGSIFTIEPSWFQSFSFSLSFFHWNEECGKVVSVSSHLIEWNNVCEMVDRTFTQQCESKDYTNIAVWYYSIYQYTKAWRIEEEEGETGVVWFPHGIIYKRTRTDPTKWIHRQSVFGQFEWEINE